MCKWNKQIFALFVYVTSFNAQAVDGTSKDWVWDTSNPDYATALTSNDSDNIMGIWCYYEASDSKNLGSSHVFHDMSLIPSTPAL